MDSPAPLRRGNFYRKACDYLQLKILSKWLVAPLAVFSLLLLLLVPAHAETINYNDYVDYVTVDGTNELVTITIPKEYARIMIFEISENGRDYTLVANGYGSVDYNFKTYTKYRVTVSPLGSRSTANTGLDLKYIPNNTNIESGFGFNFVDTPSFVGGGSVAVEYLYLPYDSTTIVDYDSVDLGIATNYYNFVDNYVTEPVVNGNILNIEWYFDGTEFIDGAPTGVYVNDTRMTLTISSLIRQQQLTGETNELLDEVSTQLEEQGKKLDDIMNYTPSGAAPDGSDDFSDLHDQEDQLLGDVQNYLDSGLSYFEGAGSILLRLGNAFQAWKLLTAPVFRLPFANDILTISVSLGLMGLILGLSSVASTALHRSDVKSEREQAKREKDKARAARSSKSKKG